MSVKKLIILDRDGVINYDSVNHIRSPDEWVPIPGSLDAIAVLTKLDYSVVVATNQSGIGRGYYSLEALQAIHQKMAQEVAKMGGRIEHVYICPHVPEDNCICRKPNPGLLFDIARDFPKAFLNSTLVGDSLRDIQAAQKAGCKSILVKTGNGSKTTFCERVKGIPVFENLREYVSYLMLKSI